MGVKYLLKSKYIESSVNYVVIYVVIDVVNVVDYIDKYVVMYLFPRHVEHVVVI